MRYLISLLFVISAFQLGAQQYVAAENTSQYLPLLEGRKVAVVANAASLVNGVNIVDTLLKSGVSVTKIFSPEHGFRSYAEAGQTIGNSTDSITGITVISLYGKNKKPSEEDLKEVDIVVFDLQDVGVRFFTYISTLSYLMEACAENNIPLMVLDRANPNIFYIDGPVLEPEMKSFVGMHPVPVVYGMTIGEYAQMVNGERWLKEGIQCELQVIPLQNYTHQTRFTKLEAAPSPNLRNLNAIYLYPSLCFFEGTLVSVGRGTDYVFETFGHPQMKGFMFSFRPLPMPGYSNNPPHNGQLCQGQDLRQFYNQRPKLLGRINIIWLFVGYKSLGSQPTFFNDYFDKLAGTTKLREQILNDTPESVIRNSWSEGIEKFRKIREKYLLYPEI